MMKRKAFWALLTAGMTVVSTGLVCAQSDSLAGVWEETVTFLDGDRQGQHVRALIVYNKDGTLVATEGGSIEFKTPKNPHGPNEGMVTSNDIGLWVQTGENKKGEKTFDYTSYTLFSDFSGKPAGKLRVRGHYTLSSSGDTYTGNSFFEVLDDADEHVLFSGNVQNDGTRKPFVSLTPTPP